MSLHSSSVTVLLKRLIHLDIWKLNWNIAIVLKRDLPVILSYRVLLLRSFPYRKMIFSLRKANGNQKEKTVQNFQECQEKTEVNELHNKWRTDGKTTETDNRGKNIWTGWQSVTGKEQQILIRNTKDCIE